ncbi:hypothetical protein Aple_092310 [Acrocarpospora pleiomorpha]|uniref:Uncharacterized protein n=1 Tax=Acrocarpospora pleiomorpha TaxID=90975 RepID=A0A5M3XZ55_9ACTN|nr:hypothetical protein Aple_092310 [Acrocarpospora pleiomorpha]
MTALAVTPLPFLGTILFYRVSVLTTAEDTSRAVEAMDRRTSTGHQASVPPISQGFRLNPASSGPQGSDEE